MEYRVENKYLVSDMDLSVLLNRLKHVVKQDVHQIGDSYEIRSIYFDDVWNRCMNENEAGIDQRQKFRIRIYDPLSDLIRLEIKEKIKGLTKKTSCSLSRMECQQLIAGEFPLRMDERRPLNQLQILMRCCGMKPKVMIVYERTAFVYPSGNVRITFDRNICAVRNMDCFFDPSIAGAVPIMPKGMHILEVKFDECLPDAIARQLELGKLSQTAFSKYYLGRKTIDGEFLMSDCGVTE